MRIGTLLVLCAFLGACSGPPQLSVNGEVLQGAAVENSSTMAFKGIPFAEPPLGELRWREPQPLTSTIAVRDATKFAPACMQSMRILDWYRDLAETFAATRDVFEDLVVSEDCLYLNIWSPDLNPAVALPVMVYFHGGSNNSGWSYEPNYQGRVLADRGIVLVSIAYRLGVFGFLSHPELSGDSVAANFGLWDQIAALKWVQNNIQKFGGDPHRVTIFGESSGAQDVLALMASDAAAGLFHGAIMQSTAGFGIARSSNLADEQARGMRLADAFDFEGPETLRQLRSVSAEELLQTYENEFASYYHSPAVDGQVLKRSVWEIFNNGDLADIPFIIGSNADEWYDSLPNDVSAKDIRSFIESSQHLKSPESHVAISEETDDREAMDRIRTAAAMLCPSQYLASEQTARHGNAWVYYFSRVREGDAGSSVRAYHGAELPYVFGTHDEWMTTTDVDWDLSDRMIAYWTQFAKSGDPNLPTLPVWPTYSVPDNQVMEFANEASLVTAQEPVLCRVFRASIER